MTAAPLEIKYWPGDTHRFEVQYLDSAGDPVDVSEYTGNFHVYADKTLVHTLSSSGNASGEFSIEISSENTTEWASDGATDYIFVISGGSDVKTLAFGPLRQNKRWNQ